MADMTSDGEQVSHDLRCISQMPDIRATEYPAMYAYGSHYRCLDELFGSTYISFDSGVACTMTQACRASASDRNPVEAPLKYVGVLRNIIKVEYASVKINVMKCQWIKPNLRGPNRTMRRDDHGFWLVKDGEFQAANIEPYIMPEHATQVS